MLYSDIWGQNVSRRLDLTLVFFLQKWYHVSAQRHSTGPLLMHTSFTALNKPKYSEDLLKPESISWQTKTLRWKTLTPKPLWTRVVSSSSGSRLISTTSSRRWSIVPVAKKSGCEILVCSRYVLGDTSKGNTSVGCCVCVLYGWAGIQTVGLEF